MKDIDSMFPQPAAVTLKFDWKNSRFKLLNQMRTPGKNH